MKPRNAEEVPALVREGAEHYNAARFWDAHEAWEEAWHALRGAGATRAAAFLQGLILATAAFENLAREKPAGFRRQMAQALWLLRGQAGEGAGLGLVDEAGFLEALLAHYLEAARRTHLADLASAGAEPPRLAVTGGAGSSPVVRDPERRA